MQKQQQCKKIKFQIIFSLSVLSEAALNGSHAEAPNSIPYNQTNGLSIYNTYMYVYVYIYKNVLVALTLVLAAGILLLHLRVRATCLACMLTCGM